MVDVMPSGNLDDRFGTAAPAGAVPADAPNAAPIAQPVANQQFVTRRELRAAQSAAAAVESAAAVDSLAVALADVTPVVVSTAAVDARAITLSFPDFSAGGIQISAASIQDAPRRRTDSHVGAARKLRRAEARRIHAGAMTPKTARRNPASVLATMSVVVGLFAVAGLPAYALTDTQADGAKLDSASQSVTVSDQAAPVAAVRDGYEATSAEEIAAATRDVVRAGNNKKYLASGARELGDDYPWPYELGEEQGGGLSVLNYYYRQCTDFVAWRINRDAGSYKAPFKWVWSNMTPTGGNASQWKYAWEKKGWPVTNTPTVGDVAWFGSINHVAYVKKVLDNGFIVIEEYNFGQKSVYNQRTILASSVEAFLGAPVG